MCTEMMSSVSVKKKNSKGYNYFLKSYWIERNDEEENEEEVKQRKKQEKHKHAHR